jgi:hypothetical protein
MSLFNIPTREMLAAQGVGQPAPPPSSGPTNFIQSIRAATQPASIRVPQPGPVAAPKIMRLANVAVPVSAASAAIAAVRAAQAGAAPAPAPAAPVAAPAASPLPAAYVAAPESYVPPTASWQPIEMPQARVTGVYATGLALLTSLSGKAPLPAVSGSCG